MSGKGDTIFRKKERRGKDETAKREICKNIDVVGNAFSKSTFNFVKILPQIQISASGRQQINYKTTSHGKKPGHRHCKKDKKNIDQSLRETRED